MAASPSVIDVKKSFLHSQVRILNATLEPPHDWNRHIPIPGESKLRDKAVQEALQRLNHILRHHNRAAYSSQPLRHAAEQIYELYWDSGEPRFDDQGEEVMVMERGADLTDTSNITKFPEEWPEAQVGENRGLEKFADSARYKQLQTRLLTLSVQRQAQLQKAAQFKHFERLLEPFKNAQETIQPNLAAKDGELYKELERLKLLMARAGGSIAMLPRRVEEQQPEQNFA